MKKSEHLLVRGASQLLTLRGHSGPRRGSGLADLSIVENGALLVRGGIIEHVGPTHRIENLENARDALEVDASGCVVLPGFIDSHTHMLHAPPGVEAYARGGAVEAAAAAVRATRAASSNRLRSHAQNTLRRMAAQGTTTVEAKSGYGLDEVVETKLLRVAQSLNGEFVEVVPTLFAGQRVPPDFPGGQEGYMKWWWEHLLPVVARRKLARFADVPCDWGQVPLRAAGAAMAAVRGAGFGLRVHAAGRTIHGAVQLAVEMGAVSVDHLEEIDGSDIHALAGADTIATLIPGPAFCADCQHRPPARALIDGGSAVALASGFDAVRSPSCSMAMVLSLACFMLRMSPAEAIAAATFNAAHALLCDGRAGSLEAGKQADFIVTEVRDYRELPYYFGVQTIARVFKRGVEIFPERSSPADGESAGRMCSKFQ
jgi:imidazolonepropionase